MRLRFQDRRGDNDRGFLREAAVLASLGISMVLATFMGLVVGIYIDSRYATKPLFTIFFLLLGIVAGFRNIYLAVRRYIS